MKSKMIFCASLASVLALSVGAANIAKIYQKRCANCHGIEANGVPKAKPLPGVNPNEAKSVGVISEGASNIYGPPLNHLSAEEIAAKLKEIRSKGFETEAHHEAMSYNLQEIEKREGKISDEAMAEYIYSHFNPEAK
jgi:mono/diheme cytochrome c family protein